MLIFVPNKSGSNTQHLQEAGLGALLLAGDEGPSATDLVSAGPGGLHGQIWSWIGNGMGKEQTGYFPELQTWVEGDGGRYWVGWQTDVSPTPENLQRRELIDGPVVTLGDGREWQLVSAANLPQQARRISGKWGWAPQQRFASFVEQSAWAFDLALNNLGGGRLPLEAVDYAMGVLAWNYRIVPEIADRLGLFTSTTLLHVLVQSTDVQTLREIVLGLKKTESHPTPSG